MSASDSLVGSYVALQINARAMVAEYADKPILALANALGTQKYVALVEKVRHSPPFTPLEPPPEPEPELEPLTGVWV